LTNTALISTSMRPSPAPATSIVPGAGRQLARPGRRSRSSRTGSVRQPLEDHGADHCPAASRKPAKAAKGNLVQR
jgi:hypothetical protein